MSTGSYKMKQTELSNLRRVLGTYSKAELEEVLKFYCELKNEVIIEICKREQRAATDFADEVLK